MKASDLIAELQEFPPDTVVEVCVPDFFDDYGADFLVKEVTPVVGASDPPWATITLGDFVSDHGGGDKRPMAFCDDGRWHHFTKIHMTDS